MSLRIVRYYIVVIIITIIIIQCLEMLQKSQTCETFKLQTLYEHNPVTLGYYLCFLYNANNDLVTSLFWSIASDLGIFR